MRLPRKKKKQQKKNRLYRKFFHEEAMQKMIEISMDLLNRHMQNAFKGDNLLKLLSGNHIPQEDTEYEWNIHQTAITKKGEEVLEERVW